MLMPMEFQEVVRRRKMVRNFAETPVDPAVLERALQNALRAPSAGFSQGRAFLTLDNPTDVGRFWTATAADPTRPDRWLSGVMKAPVLIVPCSNKEQYLDRYAEPDKGWTDRSEQRWPIPHWHLDTAMSALLILQTATDSGLGALYFGIPRSGAERLRDEFEIPRDFEPIGAIALGHAAPGGSSGSASRRPRKPFTDVVHRGGWGPSSGSPETVAPDD
jgi:nitroreductase